MTTEVAQRTRESAWPEWMARAMPEWFRGPGTDWMNADGMRLEEFREDGTLVVKAELPGIDPDKDVTITVDGGVLSIQAERRESHREREEDEGSYRSEFRYGRFTRRLPMPAGSTEDDVKATYTDGILEVRVPLSGDPTAKKVSITRG